MQGREVKFIQSLVSRPEGRRPLAIPRHLWEHTDSSNLGLGPVMGLCEHGSEHVGSVKCMEFLDWLSFSIKIPSWSW
jgi:hypothetical protein